MANFQADAILAVRRKIRRIRTNDLAKFKANDCLICVHFTTRVSATILVKSECSLQTWTRAMAVPSMIISFIGNESKTRKELVQYLIQQANETLPPLIIKWQLGMVFKTFLPLDAGARHFTW